MCVCVCVCVCTQVAYFSIHCKCRTVNLYEIICSIELSIVIGYKDCTNCTGSGVQNNQVGIHINQ